MAVTQIKKNPAKVTTGTVRLSYVNAFAPRRDDTTGRESYSVCVLIPKSDTKTVAEIQAAIEYVKGTHDAHAKWGSKWLASFKNPLRDGDTERDTDASPEYKGHWFINANSSQKPGVVDINRQDILNASELYSGCYGRVSILFYPYKQQGGVGIAAGLNNIMKTADGERLGGRSSAQEDFAEEGEGSFLD